MKINSEEAKVKCGSKTKWGQKETIVFSKGNGYRGFNKATMHILKLCFFGRK